MDTAEALFTLIAGPEALEKKKQSELVRSPFNRFPTNSKGAMLEATILGFTFGKVVDDLFTECVAPEGWGLRPTDHSLHSNIIDPNGNRRGNFMYKGAMWDRDASCYFINRFVVTTDYEPDPPMVKVKKWVLVNDRDEVLQVIGNDEQKKKFAPTIRHKDDNEFYYNDSSSYSRSEKRGFNRIVERTFEESSTPRKVWEDNSTRVIVRDNKLGIIIMHSDWVTNKENRKPILDSEGKEIIHERSGMPRTVRDVMQDALIDKLTKQYPNFMDFNAYWDK